MSDNARKLPRHGRHGLLSYTVLPDHTARITAFNQLDLGANTILELPEFVGEERIPVSELQGFRYVQGLERIVIPDCIHIPGGNPFMGCGDLKEVVVSPGHPTLETVSGQLISRADKRLIWTPIHPVTLECCVADGVQIIADRAFFGGANRIVIPGSVKKVLGNPFFLCVNARVELCNGQTALAVEDGVVFSHDKKTLLRYPAWKTNAEYAIPDGVKCIAEGAFYGAVHLKRIAMPDSVTTMKSSAFYACSDLEDVRLSSRLASISQYAFFHAGLKRLVVPEKVKSIGREAFGRDLEELILTGDTVLRTGALNCLSKDCRVLMPPEKN